MEMNCEICDKSYHKRGWFYRHKRLSDHWTQVERHWHRQSVRMIKKMVGTASFLDRPKERKGRGRVIRFNTWPVINDIPEK